MNPQRPAIPARLLPPGKRSSLYRACEQAAAVNEPEQMNRLVSHPEREVRRVLAQRDDLPISLYRQLAKDPDWRVRLQLLLGHKRLPDDVFQHLAGDRVWLVRKAAPLNKHCPVDIVEHLAADPNPWVRQSVVLSSRTTDRIRRTLGDDRSIPVQAAFAQRQHTERLRRLLGRSGGPFQ